MIKNNITKFMKPLLIIFAIILLVPLYYIGKIATVEVWNKNTYILVLAVVTIIMFLIMLLAYTSVYKKEKPFIIIFIISLFYIIITFAIAYSIIYYIDFPKGQNNFTYPDQKHKALLFFDFIYYSVVTFTTLGYGDITPVSKLAKLYTMAETLYFVIYISIVLLNFSSTGNINDNNKKCRKKYKKII